ncbi:histone acetyltransferase [Caenorhabditis elegans]|uniref:histone acetyltransferase n=1 Tax=Caenorhabditis elegans TaxID=6239 RepID=G5EBG3_CAEEL|nr:histone acetyltransferase [Caenorhabditis elegans]CAA82665.1 histone acetyltransferase [Caenorhabditis elegans]|eukprot:NP_499201.1 CBP/p300 homolog [Caenorhabditis elegans]
MLALQQDPVKQKLVQQQLVLLLHAHKCSLRDKENNEFAARNQPLPHTTCRLPHCPTMKEVLIHMTNCNVGRLCHFAHCASSRQIIAHWKNCSREDCPVCTPLKRARDVPLIFSLPHLANLIGTKGNSYGSADGEVVHQIGVSTMSAGRITNGNISNLPPPNVPVRTKEWHRQVTNDLRNHIVGKLVKAICPAPEMMNDIRLKDLNAYARKVEKEVFETAIDRKNYYHLLAEKIYEIQKELQEKKNSRLNQGAAQSPLDEFARMRIDEGGHQLRTNQETETNRQNQSQQPLMDINVQLNAAKTEEELELVFAELMKNPQLFHA